MSEKEPRRGWGNFSKVVTITVNVLQYSYCYNFCYASDCESTQSALARDEG
jgi:hypothetical protein